MVFVIVAVQVENPLSLKQRIAILTEIASGVAYLHAENPPVVHHDINS